MKVYQLFDPVYNWNDGHTLGLYKTLDGALNRVSETDPNLVPMYSADLDTYYLIGKEDVDDWDHYDAVYMIMVMELQE